MTLSKPWRIVLWISGMLIIALAIVQVFAMFFLGPVLAERLGKQIHEASEGVYRFERKNASLNLLNGSLTLTQFELVPDTARYRILMNDGVAKPNLYQVSAPKVSVSGMGVWSAFKTKKLKINTLKLDQPEVQMVNHPEMRKNSSDSLQVDNLYDLTNGLLTDVSVNTLEVNKGTFSFNANREFSANAFFIKDIFVQIKNFKLDSAAHFNSDRSFYADGVELGMDVQNYSFVMPDSTYEINVGSVGVSTSKSQISAGDILLKPRYQKFATYRFEGKPTPSLAELHVPNLVLEGVDFHELYFDKKFNLSALRLQQPHLRLIGGSQTKKKKPLPTPHDLFPLISPFAKILQIEQIAIENALIEREKSLEDTSRTAIVHGLDVVLKDFRLDSLPQQKLLQSDDIRLDVKRYAFKVMKDNYYLQGKNLWLSTQSRLLQVDSLRLVPSVAEFQSVRAGLGLRPNLYEFFVPSVTVEGVDASQAWFDRVLDVNKVHIGAPAIKLTNYPKVDKEELSELAQKNLYSLISEYLKSLTIKDLEMEEGHFEFEGNVGDTENSFSAHGMSMQVQNFRLDADSTRDRPLFADDISIGMNIDDYSYMLPDSSHLITVRKIGVSTRDSTIFADSISVSPTKYMAAKPNESKPTLYTGFIPRFELKGLKILDWYISNELDVKGIRVISPRIMLNSFGMRKKVDLKSNDRAKRIYDLIAPYFNSLSIERMSIEEATFDQTHQKGEEKVKLRVPDVSLLLENFYLDSTTRMGSENLLFADNIDFQAKDIHYRLGDSAHVIHVGGFGLLTKSSLVYFDSVEVTPRENIPNLQERVTGVYDAYFPRLEIKGVNAFEAYTDRALEVDSIIIDHPDIYLTNYPKVEKETIDSLAQTDLYALIRGYLTSFSVEGFKIDEGRFRYKDWRNQNGDALSIEDFGMMIRNFRLDSAARAKTNNPFYADDIELGLDIKSYSFLLPDSSYEIKVGKVRVSKGGSLIRLDSIELLPQFDDRQAVAVVIPEVMLDGVHFPDIYFRRNVHLHALRFRNPSVRLMEKLGYARLDLPRPGSPLLPDLDLYNKIQSVVNDVFISQVEFQQGNFIGYSPNLTPLDFPNFSLRLENFRVDSLSVDRQDFNLYSDNFYIDVHDYSLLTPDSMYVLKAGAFGVNSCDKLFYADDVTLVPRYGLYEFGVVNGHVTDRVEMTLPSMRLNDVDLQKMVQLREFVSGKLVLEGFEIDVFRDKRLLDTIEVVKVLPQEILMDFPYLIDFDSLVMKNGDITYRELVTDGDRPGIITINDVNAVITGTTNDRVQLAENPVAIIKGNAQLMDKGSLRVMFRIPINDTTGAYSFTGVMGRMDLTALNQVLEPTAFVSVNSGKVKKVWFSIDLDNHSADGRMQFYYNDLNVSVVNRNNGNFKGFESFLANSFVVKTDNPNPRYLRIGKMYYERNPNKSVFNYWIKTLLTGVSSSIGAKGKNDKIKNLLRWRKKDKKEAGETETR